jgi:hypothetical protein
MRGVRMQCGAGKMSTLPWADAEEQIQLDLVDVQAAIPQFLKDGLHGRANRGVLPIEQSGILRAA